MDMVESCITRPKIFKELNLSNLFKAKKAIPGLCNDVSPKTSNLEEVGCDVCGVKAANASQLEEHIKKNHSDVKDKVN